MGYNESTCKLNESICKLNESICRLNESKCKLNKSTCRLNKSTCRLNESICRLNESKRLQAQSNSNIQNQTTFHTPTKTSHLSVCHLSSKCKKCKKCLVFSSSGLVAIFESNVGSEVSVGSVVKYLTQGPQESFWLSTEEKVCLGASHR